MLFLYAMLLVDKPQESHHDVIHVPGESSMAVYHK